ncbi:MAG: ABC transporter permease [Bryobacterales bacterium]|nr:ABC transporter permease [Bryobacterales bacterium]
MHQWPERSIRFLLKLFPFEFRSDYGDEITTVFLDQHRRTSGWPRLRLWMDTLADFCAGAWKEHWTMTLTDLRISFRRQLAQPGFTAVAILSLALGIGANTAIFSVVNATLLTPLPFHEPDRLVMVWSQQVGSGNRMVVYSADFVDWRKSARSFEQMELFTGLSRVTVTRGNSYPERIGQQNVTPGYFAMLGIKPIIGRYFTEDDALLRQEGIALITESYWRRRYGADPGVLGQTIIINGTARNILGVIPSTYRAGHISHDVDVILPIDLSPASEWVQRQVRWLLAAGRLKQGVTLAEAQAEMQGIAAQLAQAYPDSNRNWSVLLEPLHESLGFTWRMLLMPLMAAVGFVLLIACSNVANLLLARAATRRRELALRSALGASRHRLIRELLADGVTLAIPGAILGLAVAWAGMRLFLFLYGSFEEADRVTLNLPVLGFTALAAMLTALLAGLLPAWQASRASVVEALKDGGRGSAGGRRAIARNSLVIVEMALAVVLLVGAGLMLNTVMRLRAVPLGFDPERIITIRLDMAGDRYMRMAPKRDIDMRYVEPPVGQFYEEIVQAIGQQGWAEQVALASALPLTPSAGSGGPFTIQGRPDPSPQERPRAQYNCVSDAYFAMLRIPVLKGRAISSQDRSSSPWVAVINESLAKEYFPDRDPIGQYVLIRTTEEEQPRRIVGVVADHKRYSQRAPHVPEIYMSFAQQPRLIRGNYQGLRLRPTLGIKTNLEVMAVGDAVRKIAARLDPQLPVTEPKLLTDYVEERGGMERFYLHLLGLFAAVAVILAAIGVYGLMHHSVADRLHEIGIRMALGAQRKDVLRMILRRGAALACAGLVIGLAGSLAATRIIERFLWGVQRNDPLTVAGVVLVMLIVAFGASYLPARRAMAVDPIRALREE